MRCLVKCFAMFGLGHYIYAGEDINPVIANAVISDDQIIAIKKLLDETGADSEKFCKWLKVRSVDQILAVHYDRAVAALEAKK